MESPGVQIRLLGPFEVLVQGEPIAVRSRKERLILVALSRSLGMSVSRSQLVDVLWPEDPPASVDASLNSYLSNLRRLLEPEREAGGASAVLVSRPSGYLLDPQCVGVDVVDFEAKLGAGDAESALALVRGEPLTDLAGEPGVDADRSRLSELVARAREDALAARLDRNLHREVIADLEAALAADPLRERLRGLLMTALYRSGRQADALRCYEEGRHVLADQLGLDPGPELRALEAAILGHDPGLLGPNRSHVDSAPSLPATPDASMAERSSLVGRQAELELLGRALDNVGSGKAQTILIGGPAGIGKTSLAHELVAEARRRGGFVVAAAGAEDTAELPMAVWSRLMLGILAGPVGDEVRREVPETLIAGALRLFPAIAARLDLPTPPPVDDAVAAGSLDQVVQLVREVLNRSPLVCVVEDLHWADSLDITLFRRLYQADPHMPLLLVGTHRDDPLEVTPELASLIGHLSGRAGVHCITLDGLDNDSSTSLLAAEMDTDPDPALVAKYRERSGGNPLYLKELARSAEGANGVTPGLAELVLSRVRRLPEPVVEVLTLGSLSTGPIAASVDAAVLGWSVEEVEDAYDLAVEAGLMVDDPDFAGNVRLAHALVRDALYQSIPARRRARLHAALGDAIVADAGTRAENLADLIARHFVLGVPAGSGVKAVVWSIKAGDLAFSGFFTRLHALSHYQTAVELLEQVPVSAEIEASARLGRGQFGALVGADAARADLLSAFRIGADNGLVDLAVEAAIGLSPNAGHAAHQASWFPGRIAIEVLEEALELARTAGTSDLVARAAAWLAADCSDLGPEARAELVAEAEAASEDDPALRSSLSRAFRCVDWWSHPVEKQLDLAESRVAAAAAVGDISSELLFHQEAVGWELSLGRVGAARERLERAERRAARSGIPLWTTTLPACGPLLDTAVGEFDRALATIETEQERHRDAGAFLNEANWASTIAVIRWWKGDVHELIDLLLAFAEDAERPSFRDGIALVAATCGRDREAKELIERVDPQRLGVEEGPVFDLLSPWARAWLADRWASPEIARPTNHLLESAAGRFVLPGPASVPVGPVDLGRARWRMAEGRLDEVEPILDGLDRQLAGELACGPWASAAVGLRAEWESRLAT